MFRMLVGIGLALCAGCRGVPKPSGEQSPAGRIIAVSDAILDAGGTDTVRFGRIGSGEIAVKQLVLHNISRRPLTVASYTRSCGCTTLEYGNQPLMPGEKQRARLIFDSRGERGWQLKTVEIVFAGSRRPLKLFIEADVE